MRSPAAAISFGTGLVLTVVLVASRSELRASVRRLFDAVRAGGISWWQLLGGLGGAWLVTTQGLVVVVVGVTIFTIGVVAGQVSGSLLVDRLGLSPAGTMAVTWRRGVAAAVALLAVVVSGAGGGGQISWVVLLAVSAGFGISVQQAINSRVAAVSRQPLTATLVNFTVGFTALATGVVVLTAAGTLQLRSLPGDWALYLGGPIGVLFIALAAWVVHRLGVLVFGLLSIAGQLAGSVLMDLVWPTSAATLAWPQWLGLALIAVAAALGSVRRVPARPRP